MSRRYAGIGLASLAAAILLAGSAGAADPGEPLLDSSLKKNSAYGGTPFIKSKRTRNAYVRVTSTWNDQNAVLKEQGNGSSADYKFKWFRGSENISHDVRTSGYEFELPTEGTQKKFRVEIKPRVDHPGTACLYAHVAVDTPPATSTTGGFVALHEAGGCVP
jgi:hypothetical protein